MRRGHWWGVMRSGLTMAAAVASTALLLSGCADRQRHGAAASGAHQWQVDRATCQSKFSTSNADAIARANCLNDADKKYLAVYEGNEYPDLQLLTMAKRSELAEKQAAGKITYAQATLEFQQFAAQLVTETLNRRNASNAVAAQQSAAALTLMRANQPAPYQLPMPAPPPRTLNTNCQTYGTATNCQTQ